MPGGASEEPAEGPASGGGPRHGGPLVHLLKARYLAAVVVLLALLHVAFLFMGAETAARTYWHLARGESTGATERPGLELLHSLDFLLVSLVLLILALGVAKLFLLPPTAAAHQRAPLPKWLEIESFGDLKYLLWETILTALLIVSLSTLTSGLFQKVEWTALVIPAAILMLALSFFYMKRP
jgi:uncharacterized membrane protein YqhA